LQIPCKFLANSLQIPCKFLANSLQIPCKFLANSLQILLLLLLTLPVSYAQQQLDLPPAPTQQVVVIDSLLGDTVAIPFSGLYEKHQHLVSGLNPTAMPTGLLYESNIQLIDLNYFNGAPNDSIGMDFQTVCTVYDNLQGIVVDTARFLPEVDSNYIFTQTLTDTIPIFCVFARYDRLKKHALDSSLIHYDTVAKRFVNVSPAPIESPYTTLTAIAGAPMRNNFYAGDTVRFRLAPELWISNIGTPTNVTINFNDGLGDRNGQIGDVFTVVLPDTPRVHQVKVKVEDDDDDYFFNMTMRVTNDEPTFHDPPGPQFEREFRTSNRPVGENRNTESICTVKVSLHPCHERITKPFIVVETFEPPTLSPDSEAEFIERIKRMEMPGSPGDLMLDHLRREQYDLIYVEWNQNLIAANGGNPHSHGGDHIQNNAELIKEVIRWVNTEKRANPDSIWYQNVVFAQSMGGLVGRVALREMENDATGTNTHDTKLYISMDAPHEGANIPLGLQHMIHDLNYLTREQAKYVTRWRDKLSTVMITSAVLLKKSFGWLSLPILYAWGRYEINSIIKGLESQRDLTAGLLQAVWTPAAQEMLIYHHGAPSGGNLLWRENLVRHLNNIGMPRQCHNSCLANGSDGSNGVTISIGERFGEPGDALLPGGRLISAVKDEDGLVHVDSRATSYALPNHRGTARIYERRHQLYFYAFGKIHFADEHAHTDVSNTYSYDDAPAGTYDRRNFGGEVPGLQYHTDEFAFIPTYSALNIPFSVIEAQPNNLYTRVSTLDPLGPSMFLQTQLNSYIAGSRVNASGTVVDANTVHIDLRGPKHWGLTAQVLALGPLFGLNLGGSGELLTNYNFTELTRQEIPSVNLRTAGNTLWFNVNRAGGNSNMPIPRPGRKRFYTGNPMVCDNAGVVINVEADAMIQVGDNSTPSPNNEVDVFLVGTGTRMIIREDGILNVARGSRLVVDRGAILEISENSKINIERSARIEIRPGGTLEVRGNPDLNLMHSFSQLLISGTLWMINNSTLQPTGDGFLHIRNPNPWSNVVAGSNTRIILDNGAGISDEVLRVSEGTFFLPNGLREFRMTNGKVNLAPDCRVDFVGLNGPSDNITFDNVTVDALNAASVHRGIRLRGQQNITMNNVSFYAGAVGLTNNQEINGHRFTITRCRFSGNIVGMRTSGRAITMSNCQFTGGNNTGWEANDVTGISQIDDCYFGNNNVVSVRLNSTPTSGGEHHFTRCTFAENLFGITSTNSVLYPKCCQFSNLLTPILAMDGTSVMMANNARNLFLAPVAKPSPDIYFLNAYWFELENGNNLFSQPLTASPIYFQGELDNSAAYCGPTINANGNRFGATGSGLITPSNYSIVQACPPVMLYVHFNQATVNSLQCGEGGPGGGDNGGGPGSGGPGQGGGGRLADSTPPSGQGVSELSVYPSPFTESFSLAFSLAADAQVTVELCNALGQTVRTCCGSTSYSAGSHTLNIDGQGLAGGAYFCKIRIDGAVVKTVPVMKAD
jgi:hypothetical protein